MEGHFTSPIAKLSLQRRSTTFASGEQPKIGILGETKRPLLITLAHFPIFYMYFSYSVKATGSYFLPCSIAADANSFCAKRSCHGFFVLQIPDFPAVLVGPQNAYLTSRKKNREH